MQSAITVTETSASVTLQELLNHTVERILSSQCDVIKSLPCNRTYEFQLISKWGCDGTSGQSRFKQIFQNDNGTQSDANMFVTSLVPLQLISCHENDSKSFVLWKNPRPSSPRFCRPLRIEFLQETVETIKIRVDDTKKQEGNLQNFETVVDGKKISVSFKLSLTMIDGKVCNSITDTSSAKRCYICKCTSKDFNKIDLVLKTKIVEQNLQFGISSLHAWIRCFECLLHLSYKLEAKTWQRRKEHELQIELRKKIFKQVFALI